MNRIEAVESLLRRRGEAWWDNLCRLIPELQDLAETPQPPEYHAEGDVAIHTRLAIAACPTDCDPDLLWVALLHDIGKPATTEQRADGRITAYGHARLGAEMAENILDRLGMPAERRDRIVWVIRHHIFHHSWQLQKPEDLSKKQRQYLVDPKFPLLLEFLRIDSLASHGNPGAMEAYDFYKELLASIS
jgi:putative nucleotidyltransferase with HDIG domain